MNPTELVARISQPADSYNRLLRRANRPAEFDRHVAWWRWGKDTDPNSLVATVTTPVEPVEDNGVVSLQFRPTSLIFTQGGKLVKPCTVSSLARCFVTFHRDNPLQPHGLADAIRPYIINPDRTPPSNPAI